LLVDRKNADKDLNSIWLKSLEWLIVGAI